MTLDDLKQATDDVVNVGTVAKILHCRPQSLRDQIRKDPSSVGFNVCVTDGRIYVPRKAFIAFMEGTAV